jgi:hypothetical protein
MKGHFYFMTLVNDLIKKINSFFKKKKRLLIPVQMSRYDQCGQGLYINYDYFFGDIPHINTKNEPPKMLPDGFQSIKTPSPTSSTYTISQRNEEYMTRWCGTTVSNDFMIKKETFDEKPLKHFLTKQFKWIEDITEVKQTNRNRFEIHITVSPVHHSELMNPSVEKIVRRGLYKELAPLFTCIYGYTGSEEPTIIFSPSHSETILEYFN